jgi:hypothetical protein
MPFQRFRNLPARLESGAEGFGATPAADNRRRAEA